MPNDFIKALPEKYHAVPSIQNFQSVEQVLDAFDETKSKLGQVSASRLVIPGEGAKPDEVEAFQKALGRPDTVEGYEVQPGVIPDALKNSAEMQADLDEMRKFAFANGVNKTTFNKMVGFRLEQSIKAAKKTEAKDAADRQLVENTLRREWGEGYEARANGVNKMFENYAGANQEALLKKFGKDPDALAFLGRVLDDLSEDTLGRMGHTKGNTLTPDEANAEIAAIRADNKHPYNNPEMGRAHVEAKKKMDRLYEQANPGKPKI